MREQTNTKSRFVKRAFVTPLYAAKITAVVVLTALATSSLWNLIFGLVATGTLGEILPWIVIAVVAGVAIFCVVYWKKQKAAPPAKELPRSLRAKVIIRDRSACAICGKRACDGAVLNVLPIDPDNEPACFTEADLITVCKQCSKGFQN